MENSKVFIITGAQGEGKTTFLKEVLTELNRSGIKTAGFYAEGEWKNNRRIAFEIVDIQGGDRRLLCHDKESAGFEKVGRFYFDPLTVRWGENLLENAKGGENCLFVLDEIGKFELNKKVWYSIFYKILKEKYPVLITVRDEILKTVNQYFQITQPFVFDLDGKPQIVAKAIAAQL